MIISLSSFKSQTPILSLKTPPSKRLGMRRRFSLQIQRAEMFHPTLLLLLSHASHNLSNSEKIPRQPPRLLQAAESTLLTTAIPAMEPSVLFHLRLLEHRRGRASLRRRYHHVVQMAASAAVAPSIDSASPEAVVVGRLPEALQQRRRGAAVIGGGGAHLSCLLEKRRRRHLPSAWGLHRLRCAVQRWDRNAHEITC